MQKRKALGESRDGTVFALLGYITNGCAPHDCIVILDMAPVHYAKSFCDRVRAELSTCHLLYVPRGATSYAQPLDISYMRGFKAEVAQFASQALAADLLQDADVRGMIRKLPKVRNQFVDLVDKALLNMDNGTHHKRGWAHLLGSEDDFAGCVVEARALHGANLLWENAPELPDAWVAAAMEAEAMEEDAEWDPEEGEAETSEPEAAGPEPLWLEPPVHDAVVEATSSASASSASPPVHGASSASSRFSSFLAMRLMYGSARPADIEMALSMAP